MGEAALLCATLFALPFGANALVSEFDMELSIEPFGECIILVIPCFVLAALGNWCIVRSNAEADRAGGKGFRVGRGSWELKTKGTVSFVYIVVIKWSRGGGAFGCASLSLVGRAGM